MIDTLLVVISRSISMEYILKIYIQKKLNDIVIENILIFKKIIIVYIILAAPSTEWKIPVEAEDINLSTLPNIV